MADTYKLSYLPLFYDDLEEKVAYISDVLLNPGAANDLIDTVEKADRLPNAESFEKYHSKKERKYPYYRIYVKENDEVFSEIWRVQWQTMIMVRFSFCLRIKGLG